MILQIPSNYVSLWDTEEIFSLTEDDLFMRAFSNWLIACLTLETRHHGHTMTMQISITRPSGQVLQ